MDSWVLLEVHVNFKKNKQICETEMKRIAKCVFRYNLAEPKVFTFN